MRQPETEITRHLEPEKVPFDFGVAYRLIGIRKHAPRYEKLTQLVEDLYVAHRPSFELRYRYIIHEIVNRDEGASATTLSGGTSLVGKGVYRRLVAARYAACYVVTIGNRVAQEIARLSEIDGLGAYILDGVASGMTQSLFKVMQQELEAWASAHYCTLTSWFSPGYHNWDLTEQTTLLGLLRPQELGISLTESCFMLPQKSLSGVFGLLDQPETIQ